MSCLSPCIFRFPSDNLISKFYLIPIPCNIETILKNDTVEGLALLDFDLTLRQCHVAQEEQIKERD